MLKIKCSLLPALTKRAKAFFTTPKNTSKKGWLWFLLSRLTTFFAFGWFAMILLFAVVPVPYSAYMLQKKAERCLHGESYSIEKEWVGLEEIAWQMQIAVIAAEDQKFDSHFGLDLEAIEYALRLNEKSKKVRGASTISQQTVKNMFLWHGQSWLRKGLEVPLTLLVENIWGKDRILEVYLNIAEFGEGIFGVEAAARHFFNKPAKQLTLSEAALLAAALPNPLVYKVDKPGPTMLKRQAWIIRQVNSLDGKHYLEKL